MKSRRVQPAAVEAGQFLARGGVEHEEHAGERAAGADLRFPIVRGNEARERSQCEGEEAEGRGE